MFGKRFGKPTNPPPIPQDKPTQPSVPPRPSFDGIQLPETCSFIVLGMDGADPFIRTNKPVTVQELSVMAKFLDTLISQQWANAITASKQAQEQTPTPPA